MRNVIATTDMQAPIFNINVRIDSLIDSSFCLHLLLKCEEREKYQIESFMIRKIMKE